MNVPCKACGELPRSYEYMPGVTAWHCSKRPDGPNPPCVEWSKTYLSFEAWVNYNTRVTPIKSASPWVKVISPDFNRAVLSMVEYLDIQLDLTPDGTRCDTLEKITAHYKATGKLLVWTGASTKTMFGYPAVNWAFRAWHDWVHIQYQLPFNRKGELRALEVQKHQMWLLHDDRFHEYLECEIRGQLDYQEKNGEFPEDQFHFASVWIPMNRQRRMERNDARL